MLTVSEKRARYGEPVDKVTVSIPKTLLAELKQLAARDNRSLSNYITNELSSHVAENQNSYGKTEEPTKKGETKAV